MGDHRITIRGVGIKFGLITGVVLIVYFLIMRAIGMTENVTLHFLNYILVAVGIYMALLNLRKRLHHDRINYLPGLFTGFWVSFVAGVAFGAFMLLYSSTIDKDFPAHIGPNLPMLTQPSPAQLSFFSAGGIIVFGIVASLVLMQFFKRNLGDNNEAFEKAEESGAFQKNARH